MNKSILHIIMLIQVLLFGCKEVYNPGLEDAGKFLVVDGIITQENIPQIIYLSRTVRYDSTSTMAEKNATVYVTDKQGSNYFFSEISPGKYQSDSVLFIPKINESYVLHIQTSDKKEYSSQPQTLQPPQPLDSITFLLKDQVYYRINNGDFVKRKVNGLDCSTTLNYSTPNPHIRVSNSVLILYSELEHRGEGFLYHCWKKYLPNEFYVLNNRHLNSIEESLSLGFCPIDTAFHGIGNSVDYVSLPPYFNDFVFFERKIIAYLVSINRYSLNSDTYDFYTRLNQQISAKQRILDPTAFQVTGNIRCQSDPGEQVLGFFEASSCSTITYAINPHLYGHRVTIVRVKPNNSESLPLKGKVYFNYPEFWYSF